MTNINGYFQLGGDINLHRN